MKKRLAIGILVGLCFALVSCSETTNRVKKGHLNYDKSMSVGKAFDSYKYLSKKTWTEKKNERGQKIVIFEGTSNEPANFLFTTAYASGDSIKADQLDTGLQGIFSGYALTSEKERTDAGIDEKAFQKVLKAVGSYDNKQPFFKLKGAKMKASFMMIDNGFQLDEQNYLYVVVEAPSADNVQLTLPLIVSQKELLDMVYHNKAWGEVI